MKPIYCHDMLTGPHGFHTNMVKLGSNSNKMSDGLQESKRLKVVKNAPLSIGLLIHECRMRHQYLQRSHRAELLLLQPKQFVGIKLSSYMSRKRALPLTSSLRPSSSSTIAIFASLRTSDASIFR